MMNGDKTVKEVLLELIEKNTSNIELIKYNKQILETTIEVSNLPKFKMFNNIYDVKVSDKDRAESILEKAVEETDDNILELYYKMIDEKIEQINMPDISEAEIELFNKSMSNDFYEIFEI